jgi:TPP-dependent trihydroxycyclohexane-1,2-dione (THcHDO) dehydratase
MADCARLRSLLRLLLVTCLAACSRVDKPAPVTPAQPLPADPEIELGSMQLECDAMVAALETYKVCVNHEDEDRENIDAWVETATRNFAASKKANPEPNAQKAIAGACHKATESVKAATIRCNAGPRPKDDLFRR